MMKFKIIKANIVDVASDAIVLPANEGLKEGPGSSKAIFSAAGRKELTQACKKLGHCNIGSAVPTLAYNLSSKYIIHAVVPKWIDGEHNEYDLLSSAYLAALNIAEVMGCESIAFPLLASGNNGFDKELAVRIAEESIESFQGVNLKKVFLVIYGDNMEKYINSLGYNVFVIPANIKVNDKKLQHQAKQRKLIADGKDVAQDILEAQLEKAIEWIKKPENQKILFEAGIAVFKLAFKKIKK